MFGEDRFGVGGPFEGLRILISVLNPVENRGLEFFDIVEGSPSNPLSSDFGEEPLDEVNPGTRCWGEVQCKALVPR